MTDGEFRRSWWHLDFMWGLDGVEKRAIDKGYQFNGLETRAETVRLNGKIDFSDHPMLEHYKYLTAVTKGDVIAKQTIPAPAQFLAELQRGENKADTDAVYDNIDDLVQDIAEAYRKAIRAFYNIGCRYLQFDDCTWGMLSNRDYWENRQKEGVNLEDVAKLYSRVNNAALEGRPDDMVITMHVCRGNYHSAWASSGSYEPVAEILFGSTDVDAFFLEYDSDRAGGFEPLRFIKNQQVVLGLITSKSPELENKEEIKKRITEATKYVPLHRLSLSPQCGFASTEEGNVLTEEEQWAKIRLVQQIAKEVWGE